MYHHLASFKAARKEWDSTKHQDQDTPCQLHRWERGFRLVSLSLRHHVALESAAPNGWAPPCRMEGSNIGRQSKNPNFWMLTLVETENPYGIFVCFLISCIGHLVTLEMNNRLLSCEKKQHQRTHSRTNSLRSPVVLQKNVTSIYHYYDIMLIIYNI